LQQLPPRSSEAITPSERPASRLIKNGGTLENDAAMANHASTRTTQLYDRRRHEVKLDEVERISI
jgi:hypothetical protein